MSMTGPLGKPWMVIGGPQKKKASAGKIKPEDIEKRRRISLETERVEGRFQKEQVGGEKEKLSKLDAKSARESKIRENAMWRVE